MQTFLPYPSFVETAKCLDTLRLGNQCYRECLTLLRGGWARHPASRMWQGHEYHLALYAACLASELRQRGRIKTGNKWLTFYTEMMAKLPRTDSPSWLGSESFHDSHKSNLLRKDPDWYGQFNWDVPNDLDYVWPLLKS